MKKNNLQLLFSLLMFSTLPVWAEVRLPSVIASHMVLQQNSQVKLWGWCEPTEKITISVSWDTTTYQAIGTAYADWNTAVKTPSAGGPYKITIKGSNTIELDDILIGEVWICSGQSNMEMNVNWGLPYNDDVVAATNKNIRFFNVPKTTSDCPQDDVKAHWAVNSPEDMKRFSAVGYFFGKKLQEELNVPVGLINASWGGTPAEVWTPKEIVEQDTVLKAAASKLSVSNRWPVAPGKTYNAMIAPLIQYSIAGAIWYQGESNTGTAATYRSLFTTMIGAWRKQWQKNFPFYFVQIAPYAGYGNNNIAPLLQEAQTQSLSFPHTGMVVVSDLVDNISDIHPKMKKEVGQRLAHYALAETYGKNIGVYKSPVYKSLKVEKNKIRIYFDHAEKGLTSKSRTPAGFYIAGDDQQFVPAQAKIENNTIVVWSKEVKNPVAVRYGFTNAFVPDLFSREGLPVNLFRTDNWPVDTSAVKK